LNKGKLEVKNLGIIEDVVVNIDKPLVIFYGDCLQGKTTLLNAIRLLFGGAFPDDLLRHGEEEGYAQLSTDTFSLRREWYRGKKDSIVKARALIFIRNGEIVKEPFDEIRKLINPFMLNQNYLIDMNEPDRNKFLLDLMGADTTDIDTRIEAVESRAKDLRAEIRGFGAVDVTPVPQAEGEDEVRNEMRQRTNAWQAQCITIRERNAGVEQIVRTRSHLQQRLEAVESNVRGTTSTVERLKTELATAEEQLKSFTAMAEEVKAKLQILPVDACVLEATPPQPDVSDLTERLSNIKASRVQYEAWQERVKRHASQEARKAELETQIEALRKMRAERVAALGKLNEACKIEGLRFNEAGDLFYEDTSAGMLSTSQLMRLSSALSSLYPKGLGLELLDRGESLGTSIYRYIDRAKNEALTVLATVVGEKPAIVPEDVGVFVVEAGKVK